MAPPFAEVPDDGHALRVTLVSLGGTIASVAGPNGLAAPALGARELLTNAGLEGTVGIESVPLAQVPSTEITLDALRQVSELALARSAGNSEAVVVTQGTDTIDETAFCLELLTGSNASLTVTGAMRAASALGADGPANLAAAIRVASSSPDWGPGCVVVMNDEIHAARFVRKSHTSFVSAFASPATGRIGWVTENKVRVLMKPAPLAPLRLRPGALAPSVAVVPIGLDDQAPLLDDLGDAGLSGLVLECTGGGHVSRRVADKVERLASSMPVLYSSRVGCGEMLASTYGFFGSETDLLERGCLSAGFLDPAKARILLLLALASTTSADECRSLLVGSYGDTLCVADAGSLGRGRQDVDDLG